MSIRSLVRSKRRFKVETAFVDSEILSPVLANACTKGGSSARAVRRRIFGENNPMCDQFLPRIAKMVSVLLFRAAVVLFLHPMEKNGWISGGEQHQAVGFYEPLQHLDDLTGVAFGTAIFVGPDKRRDAIDQKKTQF